MIASSMNRIRPFLALSQGSRQQKLQRHCFWSQAKEIFRNIFHGDDHTNPKKILERRYLYSALLATHVRNARHQGGSDPTTRSQMYNQVIEQLDQQGVDQKSNIDLRRMMQEILEPQVREVWQTFARVDQNMKQYHDDKASVVRILEEEIEVTKESTEAADAPFRDRKLAACQLVVDCLRDGNNSGHSPGDNQPDITSDVDVFGSQPSTVHAENRQLVRWHQAWNLARASLIKKEMGYAIICLQSLLPNAGRGTFVDGIAPVGSIVSFQPGEIWTKEHLLTTAPEVMEHFEGDDDCQITLRFDDTVIDSRRSPVTVLSKEGSMNPFALGHMINHPPADTMPNCQSVMIEYTHTLINSNPDWACYIPNEYAKPPTWQTRVFAEQLGSLMPGLCLLARRDIANEELIYDYRLQTPKELLPDWYHVVHYDDDFDKDNQVVFFRDDWKKHNQ